MNVISIKKKKRNEFYLIWSVFIYIYIYIYNFYNFIYLFIKFQWSNKPLLFTYLFIYLGRINPYSLRSVLKKAEIV